MKLTAQQTFDRIATHLLDQGVRCENPLSCSPCRYRRQEGDVMLMCAIGCLIPAGRYEPEMEGRGVSDPRIQRVLDDVTYMPIVQLSELQTLHDQTPPEHWEDDLRRAAKRWGYSTDAIDRRKEKGAPCLT